jgi:hypothetical protein
MSERKLEELAAELDDVTVTVDELKDIATDNDLDRLKDVEKAIDTAKDTVDDIVEDTDDAADANGPLPRP